MATEMINGYPCKNCTDVDYAKKNIDPAHPKDGPFGVDNPQKVAKAAHDKAVKFGGSLAGLEDAGAPQSIAQPYVAGGLIDLTA
jgi:hypothetical protein